MAWVADGSLTMMIAGRRVAPVAGGISTRSAAASSARVQRGARSARPPSVAMRLPQSSDPGLYGLAKIP